MRCSRTRSGQFAPTTPLGWHTALAANPEDAGDETGESECSDGPTEHLHEAQYTEIPRSCPPGQSTVNVSLSVDVFPALSSAFNEIVYVPDGIPDDGNVHCV